MNNLRLVEHPLIQHKLTKMREIDTGSKEFRELAKEISMLLCFEATRNLSLENVNIITPIAECISPVLAGKKLAAVCVLRSGLTMIDGVLNLIPAAKIGHIGIYRDPDTLSPIQYYCKLPPDISERDVLLLDPMIATGTSTSAAVQFIKNYGAERIHVLSIVASMEGMKLLCNSHPDIDIVCAALDESLTDYAFINPGLGDFGDRAFGTK
ncbi:MAG: uracil phosphoribosyltransferase [Clostridiales bacterium]|nr:uracil phosphoribosyltransferase [Clostridiales bacterium]